jgi:Putative beta barrel porin-7 (BBP7)
MRRGFLGSIAAMAATAGVAWGQAPLPPAGSPPSGMYSGADVYGGPSPSLMPPITYGPPGDPMGTGPAGGNGPPPGPMYPPPGPYGAPLFQPPPPQPGEGSRGYGCAPRMWFTAGYMAAFVSDQPIPYPLLTTSSPNQSGLLGAPTTLQLLTNQNINYSLLSGFQMDGGFWGDQDRRYGFDMSMLYTERLGISRSFTSVEPGFNSAGIPLLARPFIDTTTGPTSLVLASPALGAGNFTMSTHTETWGIDASGVWNIFRSQPGSRFWFSLDAMGGYKYYELREDLSLTSSVNLSNVNIVPIFQPGPFGVPVQTGLRVNPVPVPLGGITAAAPATVSIGDQFAVTNRFNGTFVGLRGEARWGMFSLTAIGKFGIGDMHQVLDISGSTSFVNPATNQAGSSYGGLYANSSNIGQFTRDVLGVIPEVTLDGGINVTKHLTVFAGYNFIYINRVARPGNQLNPVIDATTVPFSSTYGNAGSVPGSGIFFKESSFWLQGVNFGMMFKY